MLKKKQLPLSVKSIVKKRFRKAQSQKPRKKRKVAEEKIFYGFECLHCPEDKEGDTEVWLTFVAHIFLISEKTPCQLLFVFFCKIKFLRFTKLVT